MSVKFVALESIAARASALALTAVCGWVACAGAQSGIQGTWVGEFRTAEARRFVKLEGGAPGVVAHLTEDLAFGIPVDQLSVAAAGLTFELPWRGGRLRFEGRRERNRITGTVVQGRDRGSFELVQLAAVDSTSYVRLAGAYRIGPDDFVLIGRFDNGDQPWPGLPQATRYSSGRWGVLFPLSDTTFFTGPSIGVDYPFDISVTVRSGSTGAVTDLEWRERNGAAQVANRVPFREEEVTFQGGDVRLSGTLIVPPGAGPHPAIVLLHGAGPYGRRHGSMDYLFYPFGLATLTFDKRGVGRSSGDWRTATHHDLAQDALAAVRYLRSRGDIDPGRIGFWASSNSGWVAPIAAAADSTIAFVISRSTPGHSEMENIIYERESALRDRGFPDPAVAHVRRLHEQQIAAIRADGTGWEAFRAAVAAASNEPWFELAGIPPRLRSIAGGDSSAVARWIASAQARLFDPTAYWERVRAPVLILQAEWDKQVPTALATPRLRAAVERAGHPDSRVVVFPSAQHGMIEVAGPGSPELREVVRARGYPQAFLTTMIDWVRERVQR